MEIDYRKVYEEETGLEWGMYDERHHQYFATPRYTDWLEEKLSESQVVKNSSHTATECLPPQSEAAANTREPALSLPLAHRVSDDQVSQRLKLFATDFLLWIQDDFMKVFGEDGSEEVIEMMKKHGFVERVKWCEEEHSHIEGEPGDMIWIMTDDAMNVINNAG